MACIMAVKIRQNQFGNQLFHLLTYVRLLLFPVKLVRTLLLDFFSHTHS